MPSKFYQYSDQAMDSGRRPLHDSSELHYLLDALRCAAHPPASASQSIRNISISKEKHTGYCIMQHAFGVREYAMLQNHYSKDYRDKLAFLFESYLFRSIASNPDVQDEGVRV